LNQPNGVLFHEGSLYVAAIHRVFRYDNIEDKLLCLDCGEYVTEGEVRARWNGTDYFDDNLPKEEPDYGDF
jgi:hypothetical protein